MRAIPLALLLSLPLAAQDPLASPGFQHFYNLEYDQAIAEFEKEIAANPASPSLHNHLAQAVQFRELFKVGALESELVSGANSFLRRPRINTTPEIEKRFFSEIQKAMDLSQASLDKDPNDTQALYAMGVAYGLRANWYFLVRKAWRDSLHDATTARKQHNRVSELDPSNYDARLTQGAHDYIVGSLPLFYKMLGFLIGFHGDKTKGIHTLQEVAAKGRYNRVDAEVFLCALYRREERWQEAAPLLAELIQRFPRNYLLRFEQAQMYSATGRKEQAVASIEQVAAMKKAGALGYVALPPEKIHYQLGNIQFWYREYDRAMENLRKVTAGLDAVDLNTGTLAWMRIGQIYDLTHRRNEALEAYRKAIAFAPEAEAAKESRRYLASPYRRG
ncbi:MAG: DUF3808 domain-containing protein [Acidobacteria bacterium]|nr:DUF3808 domain-containing protein [Acidobacteriota bacterium]MBI3470214.1 DUF3808 domain-containing protein [Candidatus Solibacter usitatus]